VTSVIIPAFNRESLIQKTLESVVRQSLIPQEVFVVDDASTDGTVAAVEEFALSHTEIPIRCIRQEVNSGVSAARNRGIRSANHEWVALLDSDDLWKPDHLGELHQCVGDADIAFARARGFSNDGSTNASQKTWASGFTSADEVTESMLGACHILPSATMARREVLLDGCLFDEDPAVQHAEDWDLWLRMIDNGLKFAMNPNYTCLYRQHDESACRRKVKLYRAVVHCLLKHQDHGGSYRSRAWKESFAYYQGKLARACIEESCDGARSAFLKALGASPLSWPLLVGFFLHLCATPVPRMREFNRRFARRYL
jgi:glycosyltransferase involved in cell wall biosynthesis